MMGKCELFVFCFFFITLHTCTAANFHKSKILAGSRGDELTSVNFDRNTDVAGPDRFTSRRIGVKHMATLMEQEKMNACLYKHCSLGEKCEIDADGRATCVCRRHCKPTEKPLCGTDGRFYRNHCEMHKMACLQKKDIFDAKHMDCFYKRYRCTREGFNELLRNLLRINEGKENEEKMESSLESQQQQEAADDENLSIDGDDILTNDDREDTIKKTFQILDIDGDRLIGNKDIFEYSNMVMTTAIDEMLFQPPCTLFHLLHFADENNDNALNLHELFLAFNITVLHLTRDERSIQLSAIQGEKTVIQCGIKGEPQPVWRRYGHLMDSTPVTGRNLFIEKANLYDTGNYTCHARKHEELYQTIVLSVYTKPKVEMYQASSNAVIGESVTIKCHATGIPAPAIHWLKDDEKLVTDGNYLVIDGGRSFHINEAGYDDSGMYTCVGENTVDNTFASVDLNVNDGSSNDDTPFGLQQPVYYVFHQDGISIVEPQSCLTVASIVAEDFVPGLLQQNKLCGYADAEDPQRSCTWSKSVQAGPRFLYVGQPLENRLIVMDLKTQSVDEVITTDPQPSQLYYYSQLDEVFVICWSNEQFSSIILVVYAASISGFHSAARIQPSRDSSLRFDDFHLANNFYYLPANSFDANLKHGFVLNKEQKKVALLNLETLQFEEDVIDLSQYNCSPQHLFYRPISGSMDITCVDEEDQVVDNLSIDYSSKILLTVTPPDKIYDREYISLTGEHVVRVNQKSQTASIYSASYNGQLTLAVVVRTSFRISDVMFRQRPSEEKSTIVYLVSSLQGQILSVDIGSGEIETLEGLEHFNVTLPWMTESDVLTPSGWYERFIATASDDGFSVVDVDMNDVSCRNHDVTKPQLITWVDECKEC